MTGLGKHLRKKRIDLGEGAGFELECQNFISYCALLSVSDAGTYFLSHFILLYIDYKRNYLQYQTRILKALINSQLQNTETRVFIIVSFKRLF